MKLKNVKRLANILVTTGQHSHEVAQDIFGVELSVSDMYMLQRRCNLGRCTECGVWYYKGAIRSGLCPDHEKSVILPS